MQNTFRNSNYLSIVLNLWQCKLICKGVREKGLKKTDMFNMLESENAELITNKLSRQWDRQLQQSKPSLLSASNRTFRSRFCFITLIGFIGESLQPLYIFLTKYFIDYIGDPHATTEHGIYLLISLMFLLWATVIFRHWVVFWTDRLAILVRKSFTGMIYKKLMRLSQLSITKASPGKLINMASGDLASLENGFRQLPYLIISPLSSILMLVLIYFMVSVILSQVGISVFLVVGVVVFFYFMQIPTSKFLVKIKKRIKSSTDKRLNIINQIIQGIRTIKLYGWEVPLFNRAKNARKVECLRFCKQYTMRGIIDSAFKNAGTVLYLPVLLMKVYNGELLQAAIIFSVMNLLDNLAAISIFKFNFAVNNSTEYTTVIKRLQDVLVLQERPSRDIITTGPRVEVEKLCASWDMLEGKKKEDPEKKRLIELHEQNSRLLDERDYRLVNQNINFTLDDGELLGVIGRVGSGKSSLLASILSETQIKSGTVRSRGSIAYVEQEPCILSDTVRNNILFGRELDEQKLEEVVEVCQLNEDMKQLVHGLDTEIGERGVNISGGQKARISLARACYSEADIYLLDDPLSAVDPTVGELIYRRCIRGYLRSKACILVTHQISFFEPNSQVLVLEEGQQKYLGRYEELSQENTIFREIIISMQAQRKETQEPEERKEEEKEEQDSESEEEEQPKKKENGKKKQNLIIVEEKPLEPINWRTYLGYFGFSCGWATNLIVLALTLTPALMMGYMRFFIGEWINQSLPNQSDSFYIIIFCVLVVAIIVASFIQTISVLFLALYISNALHNSMLDRVMHAPVLFFDSNPLGRIINRFSKDINKSDNNIPGLLRQLIELGFRCTLFVVLSSIVYPYLIAVAVLICVLMVLVYKMAIRSSQDCQRYDAMTRSPVNSMFSASLNGLFTIRAYNREQFFLGHFLNLVDINGKAIFTYYATSRWMAYYLDMVSALYIMATMLVSFFLKQNSINPSLVAIGITSAIALSGPFKAFVNVASAFNNNMTNVQRMQEYTSLNQEPCSKEKEGPRSEEVFPSGSVSFKNTVMRYRPGFDPVLRQISFDVESGRKIGIVGRTGAGKSSLVHALFRMTECDEQSLITVGGFDVRKINLKKLRQSISVIPQSPFIFEGTIRQNLDPFQQFTDGQLWSALEDVQLKNYIRSFQNGLQQTIKDGAAFFSVGQKQLVCLARAILRNNKVLVLDEATANVDLETDALIQQTIAQNFKDCTVLTIAHRLDTIIESNKVLVMKRGKITEYDHPHLLLQNRQGQFYRMVATKGRDSANVLEQRAERAYQGSK